MLNKKEHKNCDSPELIENGYEPQKFQKISNTDFDQIMKNQPIHDNTVASNLVNTIFLLYSFYRFLFYNITKRPSFYGDEFKGNNTSDKH